MKSFGNFWRKLKLLFGRETYAGELEEEMAFHREQMAKDLQESGMTPEAARFAAMRQFGNTTQMRERSHEVVGFRAETIAQDVRFALRQLRKSPGFAVTAILMLALGIGASTAIFGFVDAALIQPLPYAQQN
ncbi:MAG TPA: permease prefix domain 1-containing protein, partial [Acidobacteriaceae bacterium]|nr:permease prefix domain 1-containing protein [Acidobacteriaceae bacterium]